jgi:hypothetical protein
VKYDITSNNDSIRLYSMNRTLPNYFAVLPIAAASLLLAGSGCSSGPRNAPVDASKARETLRTALDSWKRGDKVNALQSASPPIYVIDLEWESGAVLKDYRIVDDGKEMDANLFCPVKLTVRSPNGQETTREVTYIISTAPNLTVSRKVL